MLSLSGRRFALLAIGLLVLFAATGSFVLEAGKGKGGGKARAAEDDDDDRKGSDREDAVSRALRGGDDDKDDEEKERREEAKPQPKPVPRPVERAPPPAEAEEPQAVAADEPDTLSTAPLGGAAGLPLRTMLLWGSLGLGALLGVAVGLRRQG